MNGLFTSLLLVVHGISGLMAPVAMAQNESSCDPVETAKLLASDGAITNQLGWSVAISGPQLWLVPMAMMTTEQTAAAPTSSRQHANAPTPMVTLLSM